MNKAAACACALVVAQAATASECPVSWTAGGTYGHSKLSAVLPPGGRFVFEPGGPGFVDRDGALGIKFAWIRGVPGRLEVGGQRLDGDAPPARAYVYDYGDEGFQPVYLVFPTPGCWEITGNAGAGWLSFIVVVEKIGVGPDWRFEGLGRGWRVTRLPEKST